MRKTSLLLIACSSIFMTAALADGMPSAGTAMTANGTSLGADTTKEISTALDHAQMAAAGQDAKTVHMHLQHVVNCLVGPKGPEFDSTAEDPCKGMGNGAMNDVDSKGDQHKQLDKALSEAKDGLKKTSVKSAQGEAKDVVKALQKAVEATSATKSQ